MMHYYIFASSTWYIVVLLRSFESVCGDSIDIPGCIVYTNDISNTVVRCKEFNGSYTADLLPKNTKSLILLAKNLPVELPLAPKLNSLIHLELTYNNLTEVNKILFEGLENLLHIIIMKNNIRFIPQNAFENNPNLETVNLSDNYLVSMQSFVPSLGILKNLTHLYLSFNRLLRWIKDSDFIPLENSLLTTLDVSSCAIEVIESNAFLPLKSLASIDISENPLTKEVFSNISHSLREETLKTFKAVNLKNISVFSCRFLSWLQSTHIETLDLSGNRFVCFPNGNYMFLKSLILKQCDIHKLYLNAFSSMPNLENVVISEHIITGIDQEFESNFRLKTLDLSSFVGMQKDVRFKIADYAFINQEKLLQLKLSSLPIKTNIRRYTLYGLRNVRDISFYKGYITSIDCYAFETLNNLTLLDLSYNLIIELLNCSFYGLVKVHSINLSNNFLSFMNEAHPFQYTPKLEILNLNSNKIAMLPAGQFEKLNNLGLLFLSNNMLRPWQNTCLPKSANFTTLLLNGNAITHFTDAMFDDVSGAQILDFSENPINCSHCSISELQEWMKNNTSIIRNIQYRTVCEEPESLHGVPVIEANTTLSTLHCISEEKDIIKILLIACSVIAFISVSCVVVWYRWSWNIRYRFFLLRLNAKKFKEQIDSGRFIFDAYVFYSENDLSWVRDNLVPSLERGDPQIRLCLPDRNFDAGISDLDNAISAIDNSRSTVVVLSKACLDSNWCSYNIQAAQNRLLESSRSGLIIILLEDIHADKLSKDLQYILRTRTCIWWTENPVGQKLFWARLRHAVMRPVDKGIWTHIT